MRLPCLKHRNRSFAQFSLPTQVLKTLETRKMVRPVKSHSQKNKKLYILYDLEASKEITGGAFYSGQVPSTLPSTRHVVHTAPHDITFVHRLLSTVCAPHRALVPHIKRHHSV